MYSYSYLSHTCSDLLYELQSLCLYRAYAYSKILIHVMVLISILDFPEEVLITYSYSYLSHTCSDLP